MSTQLIDARAHRLRLIAPGAGEGATATLLGTTYGFTELPVSHLPSSADLVEGSYTGRLGDSGEYSLRFPNVAGSKGLYRELFDTDGAQQFVEIYRDSFLEFVGTVARVDIDRGQVVVSGTDAWSLLRRAYERDRVWTGAPQELIQAYTRVPVQIVGDDFDGPSLDAAWAIEGGVNVSVAIVNGCARIAHSAAPSGTPAIRRTISLSSDTWSVSATFQRASSKSSSAGLELLTSGLVSVGKIDINVPPSFTWEGQTLTIPQVTYDQVIPLTVEIARRGRWVFGFMNGQLMGILPVGTSTIARLRVLGYGEFLSAVGSIDVERVQMIEQQSLLARGADLGDYVLPGSYPTGGLRGRYFDGASMQGLSSANRNSRILDPSRAPYGERLDATVDAAALGLPMQPGNSGDYFAVRWFGAVYLRGDLGNYVFELTSVTDGVRLWVGKTAWGAQLIDSWAAASGTKTGTWTAANYGSNAGWYPIVLEYFCDTSAPAITLKFTPPGSTYTDPGGTSITASTKVTIPATSLSPLGCFDNRVQGTSHFDLVQSIAQQFGYQLWCEPMQLESGEFPGRLVPRVRVGSDRDLVLQVDDIDAAEPIMQPGLTLDSSDQSVTVIGSGAGLADGAGSQVTAQVTDIAGAAAALFVLTSWVDAGDIAFADLLRARLSAELALRGSPWEEVRGVPRAQERLADTWPLSSTLSAMRWRPGDGVRLDLPDIGVSDAAPRQILQVTRTFAAEGRTGTQVAFRQRPRSAARSARQLFRAALASQRSYQGRPVTLAGNVVVTSSVGAGAFTDYSRTTLLPSDKVVRAYVRITYNNNAMSLGLEVNGIDRTAALGGGWTVIPVNIDITAYATQASSVSNELYARIQNNGAGVTSVTHQMIVEVLR